jgi:hypothetical protein
MRSPLKVLTTVLAGLALASPALADDIGTSKKFGVGVGGGTLLSSVSGKMYLKEDVAVQAILGLGWGSSIGIDAVKEFSIAENERVRTFWGVGAGASSWVVIGSGYAPSLAATGIIEVGAHVKEVPLEFVVDLRPTVFVNAPVGYSGLGGLGGAVRYYF